MTVLNAKAHGRLIANKDTIARVANIPVSMLDRSAKEFCTGAELDWLIRFPVMRREHRGIVLTGVHTPPPELKMMSMAAALLRNYVDARVITVQGLLDAHDLVNEMPDPTVLFVPNLYVRHGGRGVPAWKIQVVYDLLLRRFTEGKLSAVYVEDVNAMSADYGSAISQHLESHYMTSVG